MANLATVVGIDQSAAYLEFAKTFNTDPRLTFELGDACALPFADASFDRAFSLLVLQFIPQAGRAVSEMRRVVRPGGTVTAAVWDAYSGQSVFRMMWDIASVLDPTSDAPHNLFRPLNAPGEMAAQWLEAGLVDVEQTSLFMRIEFSDFNDYWSSLAGGEGPPGQYLASLSEAECMSLQQLVKRAYIANRPDGFRSFACIAWACRGTVPG